MRKWFVGTILGIFLLNVSPVYAFDQAAVQAIYEVRPDLQAAFDTNGVAIPDSAAGFLIDIYDWARQYGWREHAELVEYAPAAEVIPERVGSEPAPEVTADNYIVLDKASQQILAAENAEVVWPIASLTKLATAAVVLDHGIELDDEWYIDDADDVGGAKLYVSDGATLTIDDLFYSTLVGSANNAANALSRSCGLSRSEFLTEMNLIPYELGLPFTEFVDPTGIELGNVSTAREIANLARYAFGHDDIRRYTTTAIRYVDILSSGETKQLKNTNWMLYYPEYDDVYVTSGKTGYLDESGWNLVVQIRPSYAEVEKELLVVIFGADSRADSFTDTNALIDWIWEIYSWDDVSITSN